MKNDNVSYFLENFWDHKIPVDLSQLCGRIGINLGEISDTDLSEELETSLVCGINNHGVRFIRYRHMHSITQTRKLIAVGIILHINNCFSKGVVARYSFLSLDQEEMKSKIKDTHSSDILRLLMPEIAVDFYIFKKGESDIRQLSKIFNVSEVDFYKRLIDLKFL